MPRTPLRIGLSARLMHKVPAELGFRGKTLQYLEQSLAHWILSHGALVFMVPTIETGSAFPRGAVRVRDYVAALDGLVLQGGADVSPASYNEPPLDPAWPGDRVRDLYELDLFWGFVTARKPVLGICRGMQLINVAMGGTLWQDLPSQYPGIARHADPALYDTHRHAVTFQPGGRLAQIYDGLGGGSVSSIHHQAVRELGNGLTVEAVAADDGVIEAVRWSGSSYAFGVQWHPEFHPVVGHDLLDSTPILEDFFEAARSARGLERRSGGGAEAGA